MKNLVSTYVDDEDHAKLLKLKKELGLGVAAFARIAIHEKLEKTEELK